MVVAYLRGILKPREDYGIRTTLTDTLVLEAMYSDMLADDIEHLTLVQASELSALSEDSGNNILKKQPTLLEKTSALRQNDLYGFTAKTTAITSVAESDENLVKLFKLAQKAGIISAEQEDTNN